MRLLGLLFLLMSLGGCALNAPKGVRELSAEIDYDRRLRLQGDRKDLVGKPVFLKVRAYPKIQDGNIYGAHWILLQVKRESIDINELIDSLE